MSASDQLNVSLSAWANDFGPKYSNMSKNSFTFRGAESKMPLLGSIWSGDVHQYKDLGSFKTLQTPS